MDIAQRMKYEKEKIRLMIEGNLINRIMDKIGTTAILEINMVSESKIVNKGVEKLKSHCNAKCKFK